MSDKEKELWVKDVQKDIEEEQKKEKPTKKVEDWEEKKSSVLSSVREVIAYEPPAGLFTQSAEVIAQQLKKDSKDLKQAMARLNYYINRAGKKLSDSRKKVLESAKNKLRDLFKK